MFSSARSLARPCPHVRRHSRLEAPALVEAAALVEVVEVVEVVGVVGVVVAPAS